MLSGGSRIFETEGLGQPLAFFLPPVQGLISRGDDTKYICIYIYIYIYIYYYYYYYYYYCDPSSLTSDSTPDRFRLFPGPRTLSSGLVCRANGPGPPKRGQEGLSF